MSILKPTQILVTLTLLMALVSCGSNKPMVNDVQVSTTLVGSEIMLNLTADLGIGNLQLPNASLPIILPKDGREIGQVSLVGSLSGKNLLSIDINLSEVSNLEMASVRLPNGAMIPLIADNAVLVIPVKNVQVYLSLVEGAQILGVAVPIKSFDSLGRKVGTSALMPIFSKNGNLGAAGIYTSRTSGQNGIAVITDISGKLKDIAVPSTGTIPQMQQTEISFKSSSPTRSQKKKIDRELYKLHKKKRRLSLN